MVDLNRSIIKDVRLTLGLAEDTTDFDTEIKQHINSSISKLNQVGVGNFLVVNGEEVVWNDLSNVNQEKGNEYFQLVPLYITLTTKLLFDPPPPSNVEYHSKNAEEILWRLKVAYEIEEG